MSEGDPRRLEPWDAHNQRLVGHVHPADWGHPLPAERYNLVVIGAGPAGLVAAAAAAGLGAKVALVERHLMGGDCLNTGCVPSKALLRAARAAVAVREAGRFGVQVAGDVTVDFARVMERMRRLRADLGPSDSARRFAGLGVDVFLGAGRFTGPETVEVAGGATGTAAGGRTMLRFSRAMIATGARPALPPIPGLAGVAHLTHETLFSLTELPRRLGVVGSGPIGCEMAQAFARFGAEVVLFTGQRGVLPREDRDAAARVRAALEADGVRVVGGSRELRVAPVPEGIRLHPGDGRPVTVDRLLVAAGRAANVEGLGLEEAGVEFDGSGVKVDDHLRTSNRRIYAGGDVCSPHPFTHAADFMARLVVRNALFGGRERFSALVIPRCTYTSPEVAQVGVTAGAAGSTGEAIDTFTQELGQVDRAVLDEATGGFVRVHVRRGTDRIVGATVVGEHAGEWIGELALAMKTGAGLRTLGATIHPYPTQAEAIRRLGDQYQRARLRPWMQRWLARWMAWRR